MKKVVVIGGGISGLVAAWTLKKQGHVVKVLEKSERVGGWIRTVEREGFLFECGPHSFRGTPEMLALCDDLELKPLEASAKARFIRTGGKFHRVAPPFLLKRGLWRAFLPGKPSMEKDESILSFFQRRFGSRFTNEVIDPLVLGIFSGDPAKLSMAAGFPRLWEWQKTHKTLVGGFKGGPKSIFSFKEGMESLTRALAHRLENEIEKGVEVGDTLPECDHVIDTRPNTELVDFTSLHVTHVGLEGKHLPLSGFGYLIPTKEKETILGMTWDSEIFPEQNRGTQTRLTLMSRQKIDVAEVLGRHLNITEKPAVVHETVAKNAIPQYRVGHRNLIAGIDSPTVTHLGNSYYGVGLTDCVAHAAAISLH